ncbi:hypothetical protein Gpo141_00001369 [Globisporangium polare]
MGKNDFDATQLTALEDVPPNAHDDVPPNAHDDDHQQAHLQHHDSNTPVRLHIKHTSAKDSKLSFARVFHHVHRLVIFACAVIYITTCIQATARTFDLLYGVALSPAPKPASTVKFMAEAIGTTTIRESPLVKTMLQGDTSPRNGTLFLTAAGYSYTPCPGFSPSMARIYKNAFMRTTFDALNETSYNLTFLDPSSMELVLPVVDCSNRLIVLSYATVGNFYYLVRSRKDPSDVAMVRIMMSNQDYKIPSQTGEGPAAVGTVTFVRDLRDPSIDHHFVISLGYPFERFNFRAAYYVGTTKLGAWQLRIIPSTGLKEIFKSVETSSRSGFFIKAETEQSNVNTHIWVLPTTPLEALTTSQWRNKPVLRNSWAWVHFLQLLLAIAMIMNLVILVLVMYQKLRVGKLWIGDAFVSVYDTLHLRGILVLVSWYMDEFWAVHEFCLSDANTFTQIEAITVFPEVLSADLRSIYISLCGLLGILFKVRVDPFLGFSSFEIAYQNRKAILKWFPTLVAQAQEHALNQYISGLATGNKYQQLISPMFFWTTARLGNRSPAFVFTMLFPILFGLFSILAYIVAHKVYLRLYPEQIHILHSRATATSGNEEALLALQRKLTFFELATGAELQNRFGYLAEYENALFIKGVKHASADGVYSNGFVIANSKFLMQTEDFWAVLLMKLLRYRYQNIYVYELEGTTVKQTARLVYPQTLSWSDLFHLNITNLS